MVEKIEVNLIPVEYRVHQKRFVIKKEVLVSSIISSILVLGVLGWGSFINGRIKTVKRETIKIEAEIRRNKPIQDEIHNLQAKQKSMLAKVNGLKEIVVDREIWIRLFEEFSREVPTNTWLTSIKDSDGVLTLSGVTEAFGEVGQFMARLVESPRFDDVKLLEIKDAGNSGDRLTFSITLSYVKTSSNSNSELDK